MGAPSSSDCTGLNVGALSHLLRPLVLKGIGKENVNVQQVEKYNQQSTPQKCKHTPQRKRKRRSKRNSKRKRKRKRQRQRQRKR